MAAGHAMSPKPAATAADEELLDAGVVRGLMLAAGRWTVNRLAVDAGIDPGHLGKLLRGSRTVGLPVARSLALAFTRRLGVQVKIDDLLVYPADLAAAADATAEAVGDDEGLAS